MTKNLPASVRTRLRNLAKKRGVPFQEILVRYGIERLLYRLQQSEHADEFILKGAMLFLDWTEHLHRPTKDADFLTAGTPDIARLEQIFVKVIQVNVEPDGLVFQPDTVVGEEIREGEVYQGVRIKFQARLQAAKIHLQVDIGFGDAVEPSPTQVRIPALLEFPAPELIGYTRYTAISEKYDAMLKLGEINGRLKDYFDIWTLCQNFEFDGQQMRESIRTTCERRQTKFPSETPVALTAAFSEQPGKAAQWNGFVKKVRAEASTPNLDEAVVRLKEFLWPPTQAIVEKREFAKRWSPRGPWQ